MHAQFDWNSWTVYANFNVSYQGRKDHLKGIAASERACIDLLDVKIWLSCKWHQQIIQDAIDSVTHMAT